METSAPSLRERNRRRVRAEIRAAALQRFAEQGYAATSVEQIAATAGVSISTFFRHFPAKEDVVFAGHPELVAALASALEAAPDGPPLAQVRDALVALQFATLDDADARAIARLIDRTPQLQARNLQFSQDFERVVAGHLAEGGGMEGDRARIVAGALFGALRAARRIAAEDGGASPEQLVRTVFALLEPLGNPAPA